VTCRPENFVGGAAEKFAPQPCCLSLHVHELEKVASAMVDKLLKYDGREPKMEQPEAGGSPECWPIT
jgi:hypothetical protein